MNLAAKLNWSIPQGIFSYHTKKNKNPTISIGKMQITNNVMIARTFQTILVSSFRRVFSSKEEDFCQKGFFLFKSLNMRE